MKVHYKRDSVTFTFFERKVSSKITSMRNYRSSQLRNLIRRTTPDKFQVIYKYGYSKRTVGRYENAGIDVPEYRYRSEFSPEGHRITPVNGIILYLAREIEENHEYLRNDLGYEMIFNLREITVRMLKGNE